MPRARRRLVGMWDGDPVGVDLKRPMLAFVGVSVLCAVLMLVSAGSGSAVLGLFHASKPISSGPAPTTRTVPEAASAASSQVVTVPAELTAHPVGQSVSDTTSTRATPRADSQAAQRPQTGTKADRKADRRADKAVDKVDRKADKAADKSRKKTDGAAAQAAR